MSGDKPGPPRPSREDMAILEAILFRSTRPVLTDRLREWTGWERRYIDAAMAKLIPEYADRGIQIRKVAGGYQMVTSPVAAAVVEKMEAEARPRQLTRAQLETLTVIAYGQPITRARVEELRGVSVDHVISKLFDLSLIREVGHAQAPGRPALLGTTRHFLERFGLDRIEDLPKLPAALAEGREGGLEGMAVLAHTPEQLTLDNLPSWSPTALRYPHNQD